MTPIDQPKKSFTPLLYFLAKKSPQAWLAGVIILSLIGIGSGAGILLLRHVVGFAPWSVTIEDETASVDEQSLTEELERLRFRAQGVRVAVVILNPDTSLPLQEAALEYGRHTADQSFLEGRNSPYLNGMTLLISARPGSGEYAYALGNSLKQGYFSLPGGSGEFLIKPSAALTEENITMIARDISPTIDWKGGRRSGGTMLDFVGVLFIVLTILGCVMIVRRKARNLALRDEIYADLAVARSSYDRVVAALDAQTVDPAEYPRLVARVNDHRRDTDDLGARCANITLDGVAAYSPATMSTLADLKERSANIAAQGRALTQEL